MIKNEIAFWAFHTFEKKQQPYTDLLKLHVKNMLICNVDDHKNTKLF